MVMLLFTVIIGAMFITLLGYALCTSLYRKVEEIQYEDALQKLSPDVRKVYMVILNEIQKEKNLHVDTNACDRIREVKYISTQFNYKKVMAIVYSTLDNYLAIDGIEIEIPDILIENLVDTAIECDKKLRIERNIITAKNKKIAEERLIRELVHDIKE